MRDILNPGDKLRVVRSAKVTCGQGGCHAHVGVLKVDRLDRKGLVALLVACTDVVVNTPGGERVSWAGRGGYGE